jgi:surfeit locus 1 family protein
MAMEPARRPLALPWLAAWLGLALLACAAFAALGTWQLQRLGWKQALMERVAQSQREAPVPAPGPAQWGAVTRESHEYQRLALQGRYQTARELRVAASTALGRGHWVITPLRTPQGWWLLVNRGFVPEGQAAAPAPAVAEGAVALLRESEGPRLLWQRNQPEAGRWVTREVGAMAQALGLAGPVAPYFADLVPGAQDPAAPTAWPRAGLTVLGFSNNHRSYALTWFALAALVAGAAGWWLREEWRLRRQPGVAPLAQRHPLAPAARQP